MPLLKHPEYYTLKLRPAEAAALAIGVIIYEVHYNLPDGLMAREVFNHVGEHLNKQEVGDFIDKLRDTLDEQREANT